MKYVILFRIGAEVHKTYSNYGGDAKRAGKAVAKLGADAVLVEAIDQAKTMFSHKGDTL